MEGDQRFSARVAQGDDPVPFIVAAGLAAEEFAAANELDGASSARLLVCVEELVANILRHGCGATGVKLELALRARPGEIEIALSDDGAMFDPSAPREFAGPDPATGGGVGLELVRKWAREIDYRREGERNVLGLMLARV